MKMAIGVGLVAIGLTAVLTSQLKEGRENYNLFWLGQVFIVIGSMSLGLAWIDLLDAIRSSS